MMMHPSRQVMLNTHTTLPENQAGFMNQNQCQWQIMQQYETWLMSQSMG